VRLLATFAAVLAAAALAVPVALSSTPSDADATTVVTYDSPAALRAALSRYPARVVRRLPDLNAVEVRPEDPSDFAARVSTLPGIEDVARPVLRYPAAEPGLAAMYSPGVPYEWQFTGTRADKVPAAVLRAAASMTIAVVDTGADLTAPDLAAKKPATYNAATGGTDVTDLQGHGTFVSSIAAGSVTNNEGVAGFGGDAKLLAVRIAHDGGGSFTDVNEAVGIVYAVDHGAKVLNLSFGGETSSELERKAIEYAVEQGVLVVAAAGNEFEWGNPIEYPAALLQPVGSKGRGGWGLSVGATERSGHRAEFSNTGSWISLAAPGDLVLGAISSTSDANDWGPYPLPGSRQGAYGFSSGTSFAAPQVAGAAALVWAANPALTREQVAWILKRTASRDGQWTRVLGYGVLDVGRAVQMATAGGKVVPPRAGSGLKVVRSPKRAAGGTWFRIEGRLRSQLPAISPAGRRVSLEVRRNGRWDPVAVTQTKAGGAVVLRAHLRGGRYLVRANYAGAPELASAVSSTFPLNVAKAVPRRV
jgi:subtilisin family serine protease